MRTWLLLSLMVGLLAAGDSPASEEPLKEGWKKVVPMPDAWLGEGDEYVVWVEKGWLQVKRQTKTGQIDWRIVLARATDPKPPTIAAAKGTGSFDVSYRDGRYFIRETSEVLRSVRERKRDAEGTWSRKGFLEADYRALGSAGSPQQLPMLSGWIDDTWMVVAIGPNRNQFDCCIRLNPASESGKGYGFVGFAGILRKAFHGETWIIDDGELLLATRGLDAVVKAKHAVATARAELIGARAPGLEGSDWYNADRPPSWQNLKGKVVLLDFWATWCGPCIKSLPEAQLLHEKYHEKGLVVIGIHSPQGADKIREFLKKHTISFPIVADTGRTTERSLIEGLPSYVLVDRNGKVVRGISNTVPKPEEIEQLLR
jgi:cytochrome c biogenesis protein CcmG, thiol:disulfide interchange protein DsbE